IAPIKDISKVSITSNGKAKTILHKNRLSPNESFWTSEAKEEKSETLGNYVDKLDKITAMEYPNDDALFPREGTPVLIATWFGEEDKPVGTTEIWRVGEDKKAEYYAMSATTHVAVKLSKFAVDQ